MAQRAADALRDHDLTHVIASPMERAQQTAAPIATSHGLAIGTEPLIIEADNIFEGQRVSVGDGVLKQPRTWRHLWNPFRPSWGEPYDEVAARMGAAVWQQRSAVSGMIRAAGSAALPRSPL
jgi:broad specificity phosphatase PhoE